MYIENKSIINIDKLYSRVSCLNIYNSNIYIGCVDGNISNL